MKSKNELSLFKHIKNDHEIIITHSFKVKIESIYELSDEKFKILKKYIDKNLIKDCIRHLKSRIAQLILFVLKKNEKHKLCVDYKKLNAITQKDKYFLLLLDDFKNQLEKAK